MKHYGYFFIPVFFLSFADSIFSMEKKVVPYSDCNDYISALSERTTLQMKPIVCNTFLSTLSPKFSCRCDALFDKLENPEERQDVKILQMGRDGGLFIGSVFGGMLMAKIRKKIDVIPASVSITGIIGGCVGIGCQMELNRQVIKNLNKHRKIKKKQLPVKEESKSRTFGYTSHNIKLAAHEQELLNTSGHSLSSAEFYPSNNQVISREKVKILKRNIPKIFDDMSVINIVEKK